MRVADLYIRVSTDEQVDGYSINDQEERLRKYCELHSIAIREVVHEDHSAKTFRRPAWSKLLGQIKRRPSETNLVLFTKWDRFSRNVADAYMMIRVLEKMGIEPQSIEQPLDLTIPESHLMLAIYLATPQVENMRRGLNVFYGMRRAKKEGRWMGTAPIGYMNHIGPNGDKSIIPDPKLAKIIYWVFSTIAEGNFTTEQVWKMAKQKGLKCSKNNFWVAIKNPVYCGKIFIPKFKEEESHFVKGIHEPIITEELFNDAQDTLLGRKKKQRTKIAVDEQLPMRGFLLCPKCNKLLSGSASRGRNQYYYYYHCSSACGVRYRSDQVNKMIEAEIREYSKSLPSLQLYREIIMSLFSTKLNLHQNDVKEMKSNLQAAENKQKKARQLLLTNVIEPNEYKIMKAGIDEEIKFIESKLSMTLKSNAGIEDLMQSAISNSSSLGQLFENGTVIQKRKIIGSIYPEKLTFYGSGFRTTHFNQALSLLALINSTLGAKKNGTSLDFSNLSHKVIPLGGAHLNYI